jgi:hypothetical protein
MNRMTAQVTGATSEQKRAGEHVGEALQAIDRMSADMQVQADALLAAIAFFNDGRAAAHPPAEAQRELVVAGRVNGARNGRHG